MTVLVPVYLPRPQHGGGGRQVAGHMSEWRSEHLSRLGLAENWRRGLAANWKRGLAANWTGVSSELDRVLSSEN